MPDLLPVLLAGLLTGGLATAYIGIKKAPVEREGMRVEQAGQITEDALALLKEERERFTTELEALRRDRQHDREQCRQLGVANEGLRDALAEADREIVRLNAALNARGDT